MSTDLSSRPIVVRAAGSLRHVFADLVPRFTAATGIAVDLHHGPAGLLRQAIEAGAATDVFVSADLGHPAALHRGGGFEAPRRIAGNRVALFVRQSLVAPGADPVALLLDPALRLATSTPGADPSGDYAQAVFARLEGLRPGTGLRLAAGARRLLGGSLASQVPAGCNAAEWLIETEQADAVLAYASGAMTLTAGGPVAVLLLPPTLAVDADYGLTVAVAAEPPARRFADTLAGPEGRSALRRGGFLVETGEERAA